MISDKEVLLIAGDEILKHCTLQHYFKQPSAETINSSPEKVENPSTEKVEDPKEKGLVEVVEKASKPAGWQEVASGSSGGAIYVKKDSLESVPTP